MQCSIREGWSWLYQVAFVLKIGEHTLLTLALMVYSRRICQHNGIIPIGQPEILLGGDLDLKNWQYITKKVLTIVFKALSDHHIYLKGPYWSPPCSPQTMLALRKFPMKKSPQQLSQISLHSSWDYIPVQPSEEELSINLNAINKFPQWSNGSWLFPIAEPCGFLH